MFCTPCFPTLLAGQEPLRDLEAGLKAKNASVWCIGGAEVAAELDAKRAIDQGRCPLIICFVLNNVVPSEMPRRLPSGGASMNPPPPASWCNIFEKIQSLVALPKTTNFNI